MKSKIVYKNNNNKTNIIIKSNYIEDYLTKLVKNNNKVFCIVDKKVKKSVNNLIGISNINFIFLECGENIKNIKAYNSLCQKLFKKNIDRKSILVSIGGGTLGDLSGFIASTIMRGIKFILIPTTLLSQVDSSIGGKNGINSKYGKNLIGTFYNPSEVLIDIKFLESLPKREIKSGYAEIVKHALIKDFNFFNWLETNYKKLLSLETKTLEIAIYRSIMIKLWFVNKDPKENLTNNNSRAILNFGHTFGHALETFYGFNKHINHGEAISVGMICESIISNKLGILSNRDLFLIKNHFKKTKLKILDKNIKNKKIFNNIVKDKKNFNGILNIILLKKIGNSIFQKNLKFDEIKKIIENI